MGGKAPDAPDYGDQAAASKYATDKSFEMGQEQQAWAKEMWGEQKEMLDKVMGQQMGVAGEQWENAKQDRARYEEKFQPIEDKLVKDFEDYGSPERKEMEAGRAQAEVQTAIDAQRENAQRNLEAYGIDPSETRSQAMDGEARIRGAAMQAAAGNNARQNVENKSRALQAEAINIGKGLPSQVAQSYGQTLNAGNSAMGNMNSTVASGANTMGTGQSWNQAGMSGINQQTNIKNQGFQNQMSAYNAGGGALGGLGQLAGMAGGAYLGGMEEGGDVGTDISAIPGPNDTIPVLLAEGEYVIPADVVRAKGTDFFDKLKEKQNGGAIPTGAS
jgi:hypothetical protein